MLIYILGLIGSAVFAVSGGLAAGRKGLDWIGVVTLAVVTSIGGGTVRDVLLNRDLFWIKDPVYLWVIILSAIFTIVYVRFFRPPNNALLIADALGLAFFTILGARVAEMEGARPLIVIVMGVLTGVAGGVIRDILICEIPLLFRPTETLYSVAALGGVLVYVALIQLGTDNITASFTGLTVISVLRFSAIFWKIRLPAFHVSSE